MPPYCQCSSGRTINRGLVSAYLSVLLLRLPTWITMKATCGAGWQLSSENLIKSTVTYKTAFYRWEILSPVWAFGTKLALNEDQLRGWIGCTCYNCSWEGSLGYEMPLYKTVVLKLLSECFGVGNYLTNSASLSVGRLQFCNLFIPALSAKLSPIFSLLIGHQQCTLWVSDIHPIVSDSPLGEESSWQLTSTVTTQASKSRINFLIDEHSLIVTWNLLLQQHYCH